MSEEYYDETIHSSLVRPQLLLGCDRELLLCLLGFSSMVFGLFGLLRGHFLFGGSGLVLTFAAYRMLGKMAKIDPYMRKVFLKSLNQRPWYLAAAEAAETNAYTVNGKLVHTSCANILPYAALVDNSIVVLKDGSLLCCFELSGNDLTTATMDEKAAITRIVGMSTASLAEGVSLNFEAVRVPAPEYPKGEFSEIVTYCMDKERKARHEAEGVHFETHMYCFCRWDPKSASDKIASQVTGLANVFKKKETQKQEEFISEENIEAFSRRIDDFVSSLKSYFRIDILCNKELINALALCVTGESVTRPLPQDADLLTLDTLLACDIENGEPFMVGDEYVKVVNIDGFPPESIPSMLSWLGQLPFEYRWSTRFIPLSFQDAYAKMTKEQRKLQGKIQPLTAQLFKSESVRVDKDALAQIDDINDAIADLQSGSLVFGNLTSVVIIRDRDFKAADEKARETARIIQELMFRARIERRNTLEAFIGSMPGDIISNCRRPIVTSTNLSHFLALSTPWMGLKYNPCSFYRKNSPCLMQVSSEGGTPFKLNLHVDDIGHTAVIGPTGSGKSVFLASVVQNFDRYRNDTGASQVFVFDKGRSMFPLISAMTNSSFYELGAEPDELETGDTIPTLCPLSSLDTVADRAWAANYIETLLLLNKCNVTPARRKKISEAVNIMANGTKTSKERTLSDLWVDLQDEELKNALQPYTVDGAYGLFLDGAESNIKYSRFTCFEIEKLMNLDDKVIVPTLLYLFHEIEKRLDGRPSLIVLDEAWVAMRNELFSAKLAEWLRVLRKANCAVILATQSLQQVLNSEISGDILESCKTRIMLANPEANNENMKRLYIDCLGLTTTEANAIATAVPKREYFYISPYGKRKFNLNLGPLQLAFIGASGKEDLKIVKQYRAKYGKTWPVEYLYKERNLPEWAEFMAKLYKKYKKS